MVSSQCWVEVVCHSDGYVAAAFDDESGAVPADGVDIVAEAVKVAVVFAIDSDAAGADIVVDRVDVDAADTWECHKK